MEGGRGGGASEDCPAPKRDCSAYCSPAPAWRRRSHRMICISGEGRLIGDCPQRNGGAVARSPNQLQLQSAWADLEGDVGADADFEGIVVVEGGVAEGGDAIFVNVNPGIGDLGIDVD